MKPAGYRIREKLNLKKDIDAHLNIVNEVTNTTNEDKFANFLQSFQGVLNSFISSQTKNEKQQQKIQKIQLQDQLDHRDRLVVVDLPEPQNGKLSERKLQAWIGNVCHKILSVSFHYFIVKSFDYQQMKVFASESLLRNLSILVDKYHISSEQLKLVDKVMDEKVLPYLKSKYPLTVEKYINKALQNAIVQLDNYEDLIHDYFFSTEVKFQYRQNGRYDDCIMKFINQVMQKVDFKVQTLSDQVFEQTQETNFKLFESMMTDVFQKSYDQAWINSGQNMKLSKAVSTQKQKKLQKQKYKSTVQQYTTFSIGRKISENVQPYSQEEIQSGSLTIKGPEILRIIQKLCEQLWDKFDNENYFTHRKEGFVMIGTKKIATVYPWLKQQLKKQVKKEKDELMKFLDEIDQVNYQQQLQIMRNQLDNMQDTYIEKYQRVCGKFSCKMFNNFQSFMILYLNRLIHGLTKVSFNIYKKHMSAWPQYYPAPLNILSCRIGDLIRCKYSSKQKEVLKIFQQIQKQSKDNPQVFKIIRIKNRLKLGTNDILINAKLNNMITCEIQLSINSVKSQFIKCSNQINHYIYQLERSKFGPILQTCSIWRNHEKRSKLFEKIILKQKPRRQQQIYEESECIRQQKNHQEIIQTKPFICSECSRHYYHNNYIVNHITCKKCKYWKCAVCLINQNVTLTNKDFFLKQSSIKEFCKFWNPTFQKPKIQDQFPQYGVAIYKNTAKLQLITFRRILHSTKVYLLHKPHEKVLILKQISSMKQLQEFYQNWLIFQLPEKNGKTELNFQPQNSTTEGLARIVLAQHLKNYLRQEKQSIIMTQQRALKGFDISSIINMYQEKLKFVKTIEFSSIYMNNLDVISSDFVNLSRLNLDFNQIKDISKICQFKNLQDLYMASNKIEVIPDQISNLQNLTGLYIAQNQITQIPEAFTKLSSLASLDISQNSLIGLPQSMHQLKNLKKLIATKNKILEFPAGLGKHERLQLINLEGNSIQTMPQQIDNLSNLKQLILNRNKIIKLPLKMQKMTKLRSLQLKNNSLTQISPGIGNLLNLQNLLLDVNDIETLPNQIEKVLKLTKLTIFSNKLTAINPCLLNIKALVTLDFDKNKIEQIPDKFEDLKNLKSFKIARNQVKRLPESLAKISVLELNFDENPIEQAPIFLYGLKTVSIKLSGYKIKEIPDSIPNEMKTEFIDFSKNNLTSLPPSFFNMKLLKTLCLSQNQFDCLPNQLGNLSNLISLELKSNKLKKLPESIIQLTNLEKINVQNNKLEFIPEQIGALTKLLYFNSSKNKIKTIPLSILNGTIYELCLASNQIEIVPKQICNLTSLGIQKIDLSANPLKIIENPEFLKSKGTLETVSLMQKVLAQIKQNPSQETAKQ